MEPFFPPKVTLNKFLCGLFRATTLLFEKQKTSGQNDFIGNRCISRISDSSKHHFHIPRRQFKEKFDESARQITQKFCVHSSNGMWAYSSKIRLQHIARISLQIHRKIVTFLPVPHEYFEDNGHEYFWNNISNSFSSVLNCTFLFKYSSPLSPN